MAHNVSLEGYLGGGMHFENSNGDPQSIRQCNASRIWM